MSLWSCPTCPKSFARKGDLTRHNLIHSGIKPHVCEFCGKGFTQFSGLKTHLNVHTKAKPYVCGIGTCTKAFGDPSSRTRHRRETHRREGAYKCIVPDCTTRIKRRSAFVMHLRKHGLDPSSIDLDAIAQQSSKRGNLAPAQVAASPTAENESFHKVEAPPCFFSDSPGHCIDGGEAGRSVDNNELLGHDPFDCRRTNWSTANNTLLLDPILNQTVNTGPSGHPNDFCLCASGSFENWFNSDKIPAPVGYFPNDGSQSPWPSPSSTYFPYAIGFNDDALQPLLC